MAVRAAFEAFKERFGDLPLEFHNHDDFGQAVGAVAAAVFGGATVVHSSMNGIGERTGTHRPSKSSRRSRCCWASTPASASSG